MLAGNPPPAFLFAGLPELLQALRQADAHA
jgi:hypothetical protein